jgi:hypothetical protein
MIRTRDKLITNQLLYQLSYKGEEKGACTPSIITSKVRKLRLASNTHRCDHGWQVPAQ